MDPMDPGDPNDTFGNDICAVQVAVPLRVLDQLSGGGAAPATWHTGEVSERCLRGLLKPKFNDQ